MTWRRDDPQGNEVGKCRWRAVPYTTGTGLDIGCGPVKLWPHSIGIDSDKDHRVYKLSKAHGANIFMEADKIAETFKAQAFDYIFSSHMLEHIPYEEVPALLRGWWSLIKVGGFLVLYLPDAEQYPRVGTEGANVDHKFDVTYELIVSAMKRAANAWDLVHFEKCDKDREYSLFWAFRKIKG